MSYYFSRKWLSYRIIIGLMLGIFTGLFFGEGALSVRWIGEVWIRLMQMTVLPYVVVSLISGVGSLDKQLATSLALRGGLLLLIFWVVSAIIVFSMPMAFPVWQDASFYSTNTVHTLQPFNPIEIYIPNNPFYAMANSIVPAVVLFCIAVGVALIDHKDKALLVDSFQVFTDVLGKVMNFMVQLTPLGVFSIVAASAGTMTLEQLTHLEVYFIIYIAASLLLTFIILPLIITAVTPFKYKDILGFSRDALLTGFIAQNIFIILPLLIENSRDIFKKYQLDSEKSDHVIDVIIPVTFNFPNTGRLLALLFIPFAAWMSGAELKIAQYPELLSIGIFSFFAKAQVAIPFLLDLFHIPHDMFNYYIPSSIINGKFDTMVSVMNLFAFSLIMTSSLSNQLYFSRVNIIKNMLILIASLVLTVLATKVLLNSIIDTSYNKDNLIMNMSLPDNMPNAGSITYNTRRIETDSPYIPEILDNTLLKRIRKRGVLRVGYRSERLPFSYLNNNNELIGMDIELLHYLAEELGVKLAFYPFEWETFTEQLNRGEIDLIPGVFYDTFNFINITLTQPYIDGQLRLIVKDYNRHKYSSLEDFKNLQNLKVAILGEAVFVKRIGGQLHKLIPHTKLDITAISNYKEFFEMDESQIDGLFETVEIGSALTLLHPDYTTVILKPNVLQFPMSYAIAEGETKLQLFLTQWLMAKKYSGVIHHASEYWVLGKGADSKKPRWSILHNVLGW